MRMQSLPGDRLPKIIGILAFDGVETLDLLGPLEAFRAARTYDQYHRRNRCYEVLILGLTGRTFVSQSGLTLKADRTVQAMTKLDTVIVPGGGAHRPAETNRIAATWLRKQAGRVRRVASVSSGLYVLAESGLIDQRQVVTHWRDSSEIAQKFPRVRLCQTAAFLKDGPFYTCGGGTAAMEMTLAMIEEDYGQQVALELAREFVMRLRPAGAERALPERPREQWESAERLADLPAWILAHLEENLSVEALAEKSCLCPRHFTRLFKRVFKTTPADFVEQLRLGEARRQLMQPRASIKVVAASVGFRSADAFRRAFERALGVTPSGFRNLMQPHAKRTALAQPNPRCKGSGLIVR